MNYDEGKAAIKAIDDVKAGLRKALDMKLESVEESASLYGHDKKNIHLTALMELCAEICVEKRSPVILYSVFNEIGLPHMERLCNKTKATLCA